VVSVKGMLVGVLANVVCDWLWCSDMIDNMAEMVPNGLG
jgi:hypothetical protein